LLAGLQGLLEGAQGLALTYGGAQHLPIGVRLQLFHLVQSCCTGLGLVEAPVLHQQIDQQALVVQTPGAAATACLARGKAVAKSRRSVAA
jgi:hypothetical protein